jgi:hypothetical protein
MKGQHGRILHEGSSRRKEALSPSDRSEPPYVGCDKELPLAEVFHASR